MSPVTIAFASVGVLFHLAAFTLESVVFGTQYRRFGIRTAEDAQVVKVWAFNQGFYNLFLAIGLVVGLALGIRPLVWFTCLSMAGAGVVLLGSAVSAMGTNPAARRLIPSSLLQAVPPALALVADAVLSGS
jgi:putative membrane protein